MLTLLHSDMVPKQEYLVEHTSADQTATSFLPFSWWLLSNWWWWRGQLSLKLLLRERKGWLRGKFSQSGPAWSFSLSSGGEIFTTSILHNFQTSCQAGPQLLRFDEFLHFSSYYVSVYQAYAPKKHNASSFLQPVMYLSVFSGGRSIHLARITLVFLLAFAFLEYVASSTVKRITIKLHIADCISLTVLKSWYWRIAPREFKMKRGPFYTVPKRNMDKQKGKSSKEAQRICLPAWSWAARSLFSLLKGN
jgi:hypothetical protein